MAKKLGVYLVGLLSLFILTLGFNMAFSLKLIIPSSVIDWIGASRNPRLALLFVSLLTATFVIAAIQLGIKLPFLKAWVERSDHPLFTFIFGLPLVAVLSIAAFSGFSLLFLGPVCESPIANIEVTALNDQILEYDGKSVTAKAGTKLALTANVSGSSVVFCNWTSTGTVIRTIGPQSSCITQASLSNESGRGIITLTLSKSYCSVKSTNPLEIIVVP